MSDARPHDDPLAIICGGGSFPGAVADAVLSAFPRVSAIKVTVHKPHAPIAAIFDDVGVVLVRTRKP